jgi:rhodanese-related sulfurtransferase
VGPGNASLPTLSARDVHEALQRGDDLIVLDVREAWEWQQGHVAGARHIPMNDVPARRDELDRTTPMVVVCHLGQRSAMVAHYLLTQGFHDIYNLDGGMDSWVRQGYEVE